MRPYVTFEEVIQKQGENAGGYKLLTEENGCVAGCCSGITICTSEEFHEHPGSHKDQEVFFVLEGKGYVKLDDLIFPIKKGDSFIAAAGVKHTVRTANENEPVKLFWFHSAID